MKEEVRQKLAQFVIDNIPLNEAFEEAGIEWPEEWLKQTLEGGMEKFEELCMRTALDQNDAELLKEAKKYGYEPTQEDLSELDLESTKMEEPKMEHEYHNDEEEARSRSLHDLMGTMDEEVAKTLTKDGVPILQIKISMAPNAEGMDMDEDMDPGMPEVAGMEMSGEEDSPIMALIRKKKGEMMT